MQKNDQNNVKVRMSSAHSSKKLNLNKVNDRMKARNTKAAPVARPSAQELKEQAIKKALASASHYNTEPKEKNKLHFGAGRVMLALSCAAVVVAAIVYFVNLNMPDMSLKVAAMQTGINATYPSYVPRGFNITNISSESGKISLNFHNTETGDSFIIDEEESSWDSSALLANYVKKAFNGDFTSVREQGLTIYIDDNNAAWVNGGIVYKLKITSGTLTKKQLRSIAVSL